MKTLFITKWSLLFICFISISSQSQWVKKSFPNDEYLQIVRFVTPETGWVVSDKHIFKTIDGGNTWSIKDTIFAIWKGFHAFDDSTVIVGDYNRGIRKTSDGGNTWKIIDSTIKSINSFDFVTSYLGFACILDDTTTVYKTNDGGESWERIFHTYLGKHVYDFSKISFIDSLEGWAASYGGQIFHTVDGGLNWEFQDSTATEHFVPLRDIQFTTADSGWAIGGISGNSIFLKTVDGGKNWNFWITSSITDITIASLKEISMINSKVGWLVGSSNGPAYILKTVDGGVTWSDETPENEKHGFGSISMLNGLHGFIVGEEGELYETTNGGEITEVTNGPVVSENFSLNQNYPNPFNPSTTIKYSLPAGRQEFQIVQLKVYNIIGQEIATLVNQRQNPGKYEVNFDARGLSSGVYFYKLQSGGFTQVKKMTLLK